MYFSKIYHICACCIGKSNMKQQVWENMPFSEQLPAILVRNFTHTNYLFISA